MKFIPRSLRLFYTTQKRPLSQLFMQGDHLPVTVRPSREEVEQGKLSPRNLEIAIRSLYKDGLVVLEDVIDHGPLDSLNKVMIKDAYTLRDRPDSPFNYNPGNIQQDPPPVAEHFHTSIFMSEYSLLGMCQYE